MASSSSEALRNEATFPFCREQEDKINKQDNQYVLAARSKQRGDEQAEEQGSGLIFV